MEEEKDSHPSSAPEPKSPRKCSSVLKLNRCILFQVGVVALIFLNKARGVITSISLFVFWLIYSLATGIRYRSVLLGIFETEPEVRLETAN